MVAVVANQEAMVVAVEDMTKGVMEQEVHIHIQQALCERKIQGALELEHLESSRCLIEYVEKKLIP